jgi:dGTPase
LNEDLTEAIALGHDLGHTPFGHAGEATLDKLLPGGFSHSAQSLRVVEKLEYEGKGLNLSFEVRDGISHHSKGMGMILEEDLGNMSATLEGQVVRVSDVIAYVNHDIDDALRADVITEKDIPAHLVKKLGKYPALRIDKMVADVVASTLKAETERIMLGKEMCDAVSSLRDFLYDRVYFSSASRAELEKTERVITQIYRYLLENPEDTVKPYPKGDSIELRAGDFIANMTDRYALRLYQQIFFPHSWPVL